jgi:diguanylate cyclase (GGDEF)-like protein
VLAAKPPTLTDTYTRSETFPKGIMINFFANGLVIAGVCVLIGALIPMRQIIIQLPSGQVRRRWYLLTLFIFIFIFGYIGYATAFWNHATTWSDLIVPAVFISGACFVWLTTTLFLQTANDIRRLTILEQENISDPLIGIYNRRFLDRRLEEECARAQRYSLPLSVMLIDIDHFKRINDANGHQVGDQVLSFLGKLLLQVIRDSDIAARYGGDEILIITPNTSASLAGVLAERLRQHVETHELTLTKLFKNPLQIRITVSIGVASLSQEATECQRLIQNADEALYRAKQEGRNRVVIHSINAPKSS